jgi:Rad3-related DNA helicase
MTPADLGLPEKFKNFRPFQIETIERIAQSKKKIILCQAPTGSGKTLTMAALGKYIETRILYTSYTKQLQQQVIDDFPYAVELKGRANYSCLKSSDLTANECSVKRGNNNPELCKVCRYEGCTARDSKHKVKECPCKGECPYLKQKSLAKSAELAVLNTPFFLNEANFAGSFSDWPWVCLDEGDLTERSLMSFIEVSISKVTIHKLRLEPPRKSVPEDWIRWCDDFAIPTIDRRINELLMTSETNLFHIKEMQDMERLSRKLKWLAGEDLSNWVFIPSDFNWTWKPVFISRYSSRRLWEHGERFLVMSATLPPPELFAHTLGLKEDDIEFMELPSTFPRERRPILFIPSVDMNHKNKEQAWPQMVKAMDKIIAEHPDEKGLIHTVSYPLARYVFDNSRHQARLCQHDTESRTSALESFKADSRPLVMVSPSMERGVDLPNGLCSFIIILKVPYPNLGDIQISRRLYSASDGPLWYAMQAVCSIVQATGRGMRSPTDFCTSYILDENFSRLFTEYHDLFPSWWREALMKPFMVVMAKDDGTNELMGWR